MSNTQLLKTIKRKSVVEETLDQLYELIKQKHLGIGDKLPPEREMAESLGISRSSLREAISSLKQMGVVKVSHGSGIVLSDTVLSDSFIRPMRFLMVLEQISPEELFEARTMIESQCAYLAAEKATEDDIKTLKAIIHEVEQHVHDKKKEIEYELQFHEKIASMARQRVLLVTLLSVRELLRETMQVTVPEKGITAATIQSHRDLIRHIENHDGPSASENMKDHIESIERRYKKNK